MADSRYLNSEDAAAFLAAASAEFAILDNPAYVWPAQEVVPLGAKYPDLGGRCVAVLVDMDGTTTMTEDLCLDALETMVRRTTGRLDPAAWAGLDPARDYSAIIGHSSTSNIEYLIDAYAEAMRLEDLCAAYVHAAAWNIGHAPHAERAAETRANLEAIGVAALLDDARFLALTEHVSLDFAEAHEAITAIVRTHANSFRLDNRENRGRAALDIYYERLHGHFRRIDDGLGDRVAAEVYGDGRAHAVVPTPGLGVLHAIAKGWLGADARGCLDVLTPHVDAPADAAEQLAALGARLEQQPAKVALVTSSTDYEVRVALKEVFRCLVDEVAEWDIPAARRERIQAGFATPKTFYDAMNTASDTHEIRLKPHRDLYTIALHRLGIAAKDYRHVIGFEDTEAGVLAMRGAGVGVPCAVPFEGTKDHDFRAASHVLPGALPEALVTHKLFL